MAKEEEIIHRAKIERVFVNTVMQALTYYIDNMIEYCDKNNIRIDSFEKSQINVLRKAIKNITIDYRSLEKSKSNSFKQYAKILAVTMQELFSRTDGDLMAMYKFYNYIKIFPVKHKDIDVSAELEQDAFGPLFNK